jgi:hypothetical protein
MSHRRSAPFVALAVGVLALSACVPPEPSPPPACPARAETQLESPDPVHFSLPRAVSEQGDWVVSSRAVDVDDLELRLQPNVAGLPVRVIGTLPDVVGSLAPPLVGVAPDASSVVFGRRGAVFLPTDPQPTLQRWDAATGEVTEVSVPGVGLSVPGTPYPVNPWAISADGRRILWSQAYFEEPFTFRYVAVVTDARTDAVLTAWEGPVTSTWEWVSSRGQRFISLSSMVETSGGAVTSLAGDLTAAQAAFPGPGFSPAAVSDDGRWLVVHRAEYDPVARWDVVAWDRSTGTGRAVAMSRAGQPVVQAVGDDGSVVVAERRTVGTLADVRQSLPDGSLRDVVTAAAPAWSGWFGWAQVSTDLRTVLVTQDLPVLGFRLLALNCA